MPDFNIVLPAKPRVVKEDSLWGVYEIDGLYPGYGHTLGNSLRRIILSSLPGVAITSLKINGINHEFSTLEGVKEDVITIILNLKKVHFKLTGDDPQKVILTVKEVKNFTAAELELPGQVEVINKEVHLLSSTDKNINLTIEIQIEKGLGYVAKEGLHREKVDIGMIAVDAAFTPIRRVSYEVENMRVGDRTDYNRLRLSIETDGVISPREALEQSIDIMIKQLRSIQGFKEELEEETRVPAELTGEAVAEELTEKRGRVDDDSLKTRIEDLNLSLRTMKSLASAGIRTAGGITRKKEEDLLEISGLGEKGIQEIKRALAALGLTLKD